jgi:LDH2 family malate/lactate/ureidoglycolate dehydrogenase
MPMSEAARADVAGVEVVRVPWRATQALIADALAAAGLPGADAARCAELMTQADLTGADGHGIFRLPQYVRRLKAGGFNARPTITVSRTAPACALIDGDNGMGHLVMSRAASEAMAITRESGAAWVGVRRSNHAGPAGLYAEMPAMAGMIGLYFAVANANHMAAWGGADLLLGTNPLAIAVPTGAAPLVFDMATSIVAYGTVKKYALRGLTMPEGWFVDTATGAPITDPAKSAAGVLQPMGEYKGSGLALMIGLLAGVLNGAAFGRDVIDFNADDDNATNTGHAILAVDIARFMALKDFTAAVDRHLNDLRGSRLLPGFDAIRLPGERRAACRDERSRDGIPVPTPLFAQLDKLAAQLQIKPLRAR